MKREHFVEVEEEALDYSRENSEVVARAAYKEFLALWKDADPDIPILKQAKSEYAKLQ